MAKHGGFETAEIRLPKGLFDLNLGRHATADAIEEEIARLAVEQAAGQQQTAGDALHG